MIRKITLKSMDEIQSLTRDEILVEVNTENLSPLMFAGGNHQNFSYKGKIIMIGIVEQEKKEPSETHKSPAVLFKINDLILFESFDSVEITFLDQRDSNAQGKQIKKYFLCKRRNIVFVLNNK